MNKYGLRKSLLICSYQNKINYYIFYSFVSVINRHDLL